VHQSALLAALISAPNSTDPREHPRRALKRRNSVLRAMAEEGYVSASRLGRLVRRPLAVAASSPQRTVRQRHVVDAVERELVQSKAFGATRRDRERLLYYGGLRITTTLDLQMQRAAARVIRAHLPAGAPTAAIATVDPATGNIKAIASGLPYEELKYDLATQGRRQPGSAFKPFVYAAALEEGFPLDVSLTGTSPAYFEGVPGWERDCNSYDKRICGVNNYAGASYGRLNMRDALKDSVNSAAAQLTVSVGAEGVAELAASMNIDIPAATNNRITESIGLGGLDQGVTPLEMASAYGVFANGGKAVRPHLIARVHDASGALVYEADPQAKPVLDPLVSGAMVDLMQSVVTDGTGAGAALAFTDVAGKTGTTSSNVDAWFAGYTPTLSTAVWVGHAEGQVEMPGMTGGALPATIWQDYMSSVVPGATTSQFPDPDLDALADRLDDITVTVPDIRGRTEAEALAALADRKLVGVAHRIASTAPVGTVVWASPQSGGETAVGSTVAFGVSDGAGSPLDFPLYIPPPLSNSLAPSESDAPDE
jgi:penicillin-binding protein 1A